MSSISPGLSNVQIAVSLLAAQASASGASASVVSIDEVSSDRSTDKYDVNQIARSEAGVQRARLADAVELTAAQRNRTQDTTESESTNLEVERLEKRTQEMAKALARLGAPQMAPGQTLLALFSNGRDEAISITTPGRVNSLSALGGNKSIAIDAHSVENIATGAGNDAIAIKAQSVEGVYTERAKGVEHAITTDGETSARQVLETVSNDAVAIKARRAASIYTGGGADAIAVQAALVKSVYAGQGNDALSVTGGVVSGLHGEAGSDAITVDAAIGGSAMRSLDDLARQGITSTSDYVRPGSVVDRMRLATTNYSDVLGGTGDDAISVNVREILSIDGGSGDDSISIGSGTVGLRVGAGSGNDVVSVGRGAELVLQIDRGDYAVAREGNDMIIRHSGGSVRVQDYQNAAAIGVGTFGAAQNFGQEQSGSVANAEARKDNARLAEVSDAAAAAAANGTTIALDAGGLRTSLEIDLAPANGDVTLLYTSTEDRLDVVA